MKPNLRFIFLFAALITILALAGCSPVSSSDGVIVGRSYRLNSGDRVDHDLVVFGGSAILEKDSTVNGSVTVFGGSIVIDGNVEGDVSAFGGVVSLGDHAVVHGNVVTFGGAVSRSDSAVVKGSVGAPRQPIRPPAILGPVVTNTFQAIGDFIWRIFQSFALAALAVLVSLFGLRPMERAGDAMVSQPALAAGMGLLTILAGPLALLILAITIVLSPVSLIGFLIMAVGALFGWLVLGLITGERVAHLLKQEWSGPVSAGVGTLVLSLGMNLIGIIPCIGWAVVAVVFSIGVGGVVLTRFGIQSYPLRPVEVIAPPPPAAPAGGDMGGIA